MGVEQRRSIFGRTIKCPECAAPLLWRGTAEVVECRYCGAHVVVSSGATTEAPATARSKTKSSPIVTAVVLIAIVGFISALAISRIVGGPHALSEAEVARLSPSMSFARLSKVSSARVWGSRVAFKLDHATYAKLTFVYGGKGNKQVERLLLDANKGADASEAVATARRLIPRLHATDGRWTISLDNGASFTVRADGGVDYYVPVSATDARAHTDAAWQVVLAMLGHKVKLNDATRRAYLGLGYRLSRLARLDPRTVVDEVAKAAKPLFPAAHWKRSAGELQVTLRLDHPWFARVNLQWANAAGGVMREAMFRPEQIKPFAAEQTIAACVTKHLGAEPTVHVTDHLAKTKDRRWTTDALAVRLWMSHFIVTPRRDGSGDTTTAWRSLLAGLERCASASK